LSGGFSQRPATSPALAVKSELRDSLNVSTASRHACAMSAGRQLHNTIDHRSRQRHLAGGWVLIRESGSTTLALKHFCRRYTEGLSLPVRRLISLVPIPPSSPTRSALLRCTSEGCSGSPPPLPDGPVGSMHLNHGSFVHPSNTHSRKPSGIPKGAFRHHWERICRETHKTAKASPPDQIRPRSP
jgi:hypothetical protein